MVEVVPLTKAVGGLSVSSVCRRVVADVDVDVVSPPTSVATFGFFGDSASAETKNLVLQKNLQDELKSFSLLTIRTFRELGDRAEAKPSSVRVRRLS